MKAPWHLWRWGLTGILLALTLRQAPPQTWLSHLGGLDPGWLAASALLMAGIVVVNTWKWQLLLEVHGIRPRLLRLLYHYSVGYFFNAFVTGTGDLKRAASLGAEEGSTPAVFASVLTERWTGVIGQLGLASTTLAVACWVHQAPLLPLLIFSAGLTGLLAAGYLWLEDDPRDPSSLPPGLRGRALGAIRSLRASLSSYRHQRGPWWLALGLSLVGPLLLVAIHWTLARALSWPIGMESLALYIPTVSVFAQLPVTINGFGLQDVFMVTLLKDSLQPDQAMALSMGFHLLRLGVGGCGGLLFLLAPGLGASPGRAQAPPESPR